MQDIFRLTETPENKEQEPGTISGLGVVIINAETGQIWGIRERSNKSRTGREQGQLSIPLETRKIGETILENLHGAMAEAFDDFDNQGKDIRAEVHSNLFFVAGEALHSDGIQSVQNGRIIHGDIAIMMYDGPAITVQPFNALEVGEAGWHDPQDFLSDEARPLAQLMVREVLSNGMYETNSSLYHTSPERREPALPSGFSIRETYRTREEVKDVA